jgi:regulatory protein
MSAAVTLLARRDFCSSELAARLSSQGFDQQAIGSAVEELHDRHYLDDARYARQFVTVHAERGHGPIRIRHDLVALGVSEQQIDSALAERTDWATQAQTLRARRFGAAPPHDWAEKARQVRFLMYRGFSQDDIRSALNTDMDIDMTSDTDT